MAVCNKLRRLGMWCAICAVGLSCAGGVGETVSKAVPRGKSQRRTVELTPWEKASEGRDALEAIPEGSRKRPDYTRAMDRFREIYHDDPQNKYAPASVNAVAELLAEEGRDFNDSKSLKDAIAQYEFLRQQYPGSSLRVAALLAEGQIYENDLRDTASARERYAQLVKQYPRSEQAEEARAGIASVDATHRQVAPLSAAPHAAKAAKPDKVSGKAAKEEQTVSSSLLAPLAPTDSEVSRVTTEPPATAGSGIQPGPSHVARTSLSTKGGGGYAQVSGIRHWSTPNYTRVAIDLGDDVTYEAARVPTPDRIYFDLHGTRLAQELVGKSFAVTDDGFLKKIRAAQFSNDVTRVVLDVNDVTEYSAFLLPNPYRLIIDIHGRSGQPNQVAGQAAPPPAGVQAQTDTREAEPQSPAPRTASEARPTTRRPVPNAVASSNAGTTTEVAALSEQPGKVEATSVPTSQPISAVVPDAGGSAGGARKGKRGKVTQVDPLDPAAPARAAVPTADGQTSLVRALGLKIGRIVIDAGHGGHDSGTIGVDGLEEKDVVLDVALRLGKMLHERLGSEIIYTRSDDTFIPLETRTAIANKAQADLFLSIHANSSSDPSARGVETYYLNFTSQPDALEVAARENAVSNQSIYQLSDLVKKIALKEKIGESREFAADVETSLYSGLQRGNAGLKNRGVKKAPFVVLIGANMPSILAEISFVTNPRDAEQLRQSDYRERVAESIYKGVAKYAEGLSATKGTVEQASRMTPDR